VLTAAASTVSAWRADPTARSEHRWIFPDVQYLRPALARALPEYPEMVDRKSWLALHDARIAQLRAAGWTRGLFRDPRQAEWLADLVVGRHSYSAIAKAVHVSLPPLHKQLAALARLIELDLPKPIRGGRPKSV
jgi:hypothetical protein